MSTLRVQRVGELLKRAIGEAIQREIPLDQAGLVTVNEVRPAPDLRSARVFLGVIGKPEQRRRARTLLDNLRGRIQHDVARAVVLRYTPVLRFEMDDTIERGNHVLEILQEIEKTLPPDTTPAVAAITAPTRIGTQADNSTNSTVRPPSPPSEGGEGRGEEGRRALEKSLPSLAPRGTKDTLPTAASRPTTTPASAAKSKSKKSKPAASPRAET